MSLEVRGSDGHVWDVTRLGRGKVLSLSQSPQAQNAIKDFLTFTAVGTETPTGAGDYFFYMKNDGTYPICISRLAVDGGTADEVELRAVTGTAASGTALTPLNRTRSSGKTVDATIESGVDITGLTSAGALERLVVPADTNNELVFVDRPIVLRQNQAVAIAAITGTAALNFRVDFWVDLSDPAVI